MHYALFFLGMSKYIVILLDISTFTRLLASPAAGSLYTLALLVSNALSGGGVVRFALCIASKKTQLFERSRLADENLQPISKRGMKRH